MAYSTIGDGAPIEMCKVEGRLSSFSFSNLLLLLLCMPVVYLFVPILSHFEIARRNVKSLFSSNYFERIHVHQRLRTFVLTFIAIISFQSQS